MYLGAPPAMRTHLDWSTCGLLIWVQAPEFQMGNTSIIGQMSCLYSRTLFLMERPPILSRIGPNTPSLWSAFFLTWSTEGKQVRCVSWANPQKTGSVNPMDWLCRQLYWMGFGVVPTGLCKEHQGTLWDIHGNPPFSEPPLRIAKIWLLVADEHHWFAGSGHYGHVVCIEGHLDMMWLRGYVDTQTEQDERN